MDKAAKIRRSVEEVVNGAFRAFRPRSALHAEH